MSYQRPTTYNLGPQLPQGPVFHNHQQQQQQQQQQPHHRQADPPSSPEMSSSSASGYRLSGVRTGSSEPDTKRESSQQQQQQATSAPHTYPSTMPPPNVQQPPVPFYPYPPYTSQSHPSQPQSQRLNDGTNPQQQQFVPQPSVGGTEQHRMPGLKTESGGPPSLPVIYTQAVPMIVGTSPPSSSTTLSSALSVPSSSSADARSPADTDATSPGSALATPDSATYSLAATPGSVPRLPPILQVEKVQVTTTATQAASASRRRNEAHFVCPVPGCGSTFTRRFNLRGHLRSHTEERPYVCEWPGCGKCFARQHDCKRHQALHSQRTQANVCQGCKKTFSRLDALNRHLRSDGGVECRVVHQQAAGSSVDGNSSSAGMSGGGADSSRLALASAIPSGGPSHAQQQSADHPNQPPTA